MSDPALDRFDIVVIGAGHAGCEAALASARMGCETALVTLDARAVARMSCNPAIGGLAKGHLVREIDALGGEMGRAIDETGIQFRLLNASRGPAVQAPRAQADKDAYSNRMRRVVESAPRLTLVEGEACDLLVEEGVLGGVALASGRVLLTTCAVVTTGTFLRGLLHVGLENRPGGRIEERAAVGLSESLARLGFPMGRLKTGTPPRVLKTSVDFDALERQPGDPEPVPFSFETDAITTPQVDCHITFTNPKTHALIRDNLGLSPRYTGRIAARGPRRSPWSGGPPRPWPCGGGRLSCYREARRTSACWWTPLCSRGRPSRTGCSPRAPSTGCSWTSTAPTCASPSTAGARV